MSASAASAVPASPITTISGSGFQQVAHAPTDDLVIVDEEYADPPPIGVLVVHVPGSCLEGNGSSR